jgi:hypothetical protein
MLDDVYEKQFQNLEEEDVEIDLEDIRKLFDKDKKEEKFLKQKRCYMAS